MKNGNTKVAKKKKLVQNCDNPGLCSGSGLHASSKGADYTN